MDKLERINQLKAELEQLQNEVQEETINKWCGKIIRVEESSWNRVTFYRVNSVDEDLAITTAIYYDSRDDEVSFDTYEDEVSVDVLLDGKVVSLCDIEEELMKVSKCRVEWLLKSYQEEWD